MRRPSSTAQLSSTPISDLPYLYASSTAHPFVWFVYRAALKANPRPQPRTAYASPSPASPPGTYTLLARSSSL